MLRLPILLSGLSLLLGCGDVVNEVENPDGGRGGQPTPTTAGGSDGGHGGTSAANGGGGSGGPGGSGGEGGGGGTAPAEKIGLVWLFTAPTGTEPTTTVTAGFVTEWVVAPAQQFGSCEVSVVTQQSADDAVSAGDIVIDGGTSPITLVPEPIPQSPGVSYPPFEDPNQNLWAPGTTLTVTAQGDVVPAFTLQVDACNMVTVSAPDVSDGVTIDDSEDLAIAWTGGTTEQVMIELNSQGTQIRCMFAAASMAGTVPKEALQLLPAGLGTMFGQVHRASSTPLAGDWDVSVWARTMALSTTSPSGDMRALITVP